MLSLDPATGTLDRLQTVSAWPEGATGAPWAAEIRVTPDGRHLYASERRTSTLSAFAIDAGTGLLTPVGVTSTETEPRGFAITADGRFLVEQQAYIEERDGRIGWMRVVCSGFRPI